MEETLFQTYKNKFKLTIIFSLTLSFLKIEIFIHTYIEQYLNQLFSSVHVSSHRTLLQRGVHEPSEWNKQIRTVNPIPTVAAKFPGWNFPVSNWTSRDVLPTPLSPSRIVWKEKEGGKREYSRLSLSTSYHRVHVTQSPRYPFIHSIRLNLALESNWYSTLFDFKIIFFFLLKNSVREISKYSRKRIFHTLLPENDFQLESNPNN